MIKHRPAWYAAFMANLAKTWRPDMNQQDIAKLQHEARVKADAKGNISQP